MPGLLLRKTVRLVLCLVGATILTGCATRPPMILHEQKFVSDSSQGRDDNLTSAMAEPLPPKKIPVVNSTYAKLTELNLNNSGNEITIKPGTTLQASLHYSLNSPEGQPVSHQIIVGLAKRSAQACIYQGGSQAEGVANFVLRSPAKPGKYEIRFRILQAADCAEALKEGWNADNSPARETTIGTLLVTRKAPEDSLPALNKG